MFRVRISARNEHRTYISARVSSGKMINVHRDVNERGGRIDRVNGEVLFQLYLRVSLQ